MIQEEGKDYFEKENTRRKVNSYRGMGGYEKSSWDKKAKIIRMGNKE